jgi:crotonobetainyl-CoA:carnitine CoA-transferase CaiB-like acyl-CoA transferase
MLQPFPSLADRRILDLTDRWGQFAGKLLSQLGADVVLGEPAGGHELRRAWPLAVLPDGEVVSAYFWHFNVGKRAVVWEPTSEAGREQAAALVAAADVVLCGRASHQLLQQSMPDVLDRTRVVAVSPYGLCHPPGPGDDDLHVAASSAMGGLSGYGTDEESSPIIPPVEQPMHSAGMYAAISALLALRSDPAAGGAFFDVSAQAAAFQGTEMTFAYAAYRHELLRRRTGGYATAFPSGRWQLTTADGAYAYVFGLLPRTQREWDDLRSWIRSAGDIEDLDDPRYERVEALRGLSPYDVTEAGLHASDVIARFVQSQDAETVYRRGQAIGLGWARVFQPEETLGEEQFEVRQLFHRTAWPGREESYLTQSLPWVVRGTKQVRPAPDIVRPPSIGQHTDDVVAEWLLPIRKRAEKEDHTL